MNTSRSTSQPFRSERRGQSRSRRIVGDDDPAVGEAFVPAGPSRRSAAPRSHRTGLSTRRRLPSMKSGKSSLNRAVPNREGSTAGARGLLPPPEVRLDPVAVLAHDGRRYRLPMRARRRTLPSWIRVSDRRRVASTSGRLRTPRGPASGARLPTSRDRCSPPWRIRDSREGRCSISAAASATWRSQRSLGAPRAPTASTSAKEPSRRPGRSPRSAGWRTERPSRWATAPSSRYGDTTWSR